MQHDHFGPRLRQLRKAAGITAQAAADRAQVSLNTWTRWELGKTMPQLCRADQIASAIGCPVVALTAHETIRPIADLVITQATYERVRANGNDSQAELEQAIANAAITATRQHFAQPDGVQPRVRRRPTGTAKRDAGIARAVAGRAAKHERERQAKGLTSRLEDSNTGSMPPQP